MIPMSRTLIVFTSLAALPALGCYVEARTADAEEVGAPPPEPPPQVEVVPASPGPDYVWIAGFHRWDGRGYVWVRGHYDRRPRQQAQWVRAHWERRGRGHVWVEGHWN
ncbi:MAG TPA: hypothetical protein VGM06_06065 [Polyangiaceae bacterium]|jgi:hypothetical protein